MQTINLTPLLEALIVLIGAVITAYVVPWVKSRTSAEEQARIAMWVNVAVYAAEKLYGAGNGDKKLEYATKVLEDHGVLLDTASLAALINAEIKKMEQLEAYVVEAEDN